MDDDVVFRFIVPGKLPSLNEVIQANRQHAQVGAELKRAVQYRIMWAIKQASVSSGIKRIPDGWTDGCDLHVVWLEPDRRRDVDNIESGNKFILDALVKLEFLPDDSQRYVKQIVPLVGLLRGEALKKYPGGCVVVRVMRHFPGLDLDEDYIHNLIL